MTPDVGSVRDLPRAPARGRGARWGSRPRTSASDSRIAIGTARPRIMAAVSEASDPSRARAPAKPEPLLFAAEAQAQRIWVKTCAGVPVVVRWCRPPLLMRDGERRPDQHDHRHGQDREGDPLHDGGVELAAQVLGASSHHLTRKRKTQRRTITIIPVIPSPHAPEDDFTQEL